MRAGLLFVAFELFLTYGPPQSWLRMGFKSNPKLRKDQIEECIRQAKSRLVGSLHLLIQARGPICYRSLSAGDATGGMQTRSAALLVFPTHMHVLHCAHAAGCMRSKRHQQMLWKQQSGTVQLRACRRCTQPAEGCQALCGPACGA